MIKPLRDVTKHLHGGGLGLAEGGLGGLALGVPLSGLLLTLGLVGSHDILVAPAELSSKLAEVGVLAARLQAGDTEGVGDNDLLDLVEGVGDTLDSLVALHQELQLVADVRARDDELLTADHNNLLPKQSLLRDEGGEAAQEVAPRVDHCQLLKR